MRRHRPGRDPGLASRVRLIREELFGTNGVPLLAEALGLSCRDWLRFEAGAPLPAELVLRFVEFTGASPRWLLSGGGERYREPLAPRTRPSEEGS